MLFVIISSFLIIFTLPWLLCFILIRFFFYLLSCNSFLFFWWLRCLTWSRYYFRMRSFLIIIVFRPFFKCSFHLLFRLLRIFTAIIIGVVILVPISLISTLSDIRVSCFLPIIISTLRYLLPLIHFFRFLILFVFLLVFALSRWFCIRILFILLLMIILIIISIIIIIITSITTTTSPHPTLGIIR